MKGQVVTLSPSDMDWASDVGRKRMLHSLLALSKPNFNERRFPGEMWTNHILGAGAELAVSRYLSVEWPATIDTFRRADIGKNTEVRFSPTRCDTKVRLDDRDTLRIVGVAGLFPDYRIVGWIRARDAKKRRWKHTRTDPHCYFVPHDDLLEFRPR